MTPDEMPNLGYSDLRMGDRGFGRHRRTPKRYLTASCRARELQGELGVPNQPASIGRGEGADRDDLSGIEKIGDSFCRTDNPLAEAVESESRSSVMPSCALAPAALHPIQEIEGRVAGSDVQRDVRLAIGGPKPGGAEQPEAIDMEAVYREYHRRVFAWCSRIVRNAEDAEDLTQDAFVQIVRKIHTFRGEASLSTWMFRVVMNTIFMQLRRKRLSQISLDEVFDDEEGTPWPRNVLSADDNYLTSVTARVDIDRAISEMPEGFKVVLLLHDVEECTHAEIAAIRGWTEGTSKSQLHKARNRLRELLG